MKTQRLNTIERKASMRTTLAPANDRPFKKLSDDDLNACIGLLHGIAPADEAPAIDTSQVTREEMIAAAVDVIKHVKGLPDFERQLLSEVGRLYAEWRSIGYFETEFKQWTRKQVFDYAIECAVERLEPTKANGVS